MQNDKIYLKVVTEIPRKRRLKMAYNVSTSGGQKIPAIRFSAQYLHELGFRVGGMFDMIINDDNSLTLVPVPEGADGVDAGAEKLFDGEENT